MKGFSFKRMSCIAALLVASATVSYAQTIVTADLTSLGPQDGRVGGAASGSGFITLSINNSSSTANTALRIGDFEFLGFLFRDEAYRSILSFPTNTIPANATITAASLFVTRGATSGNVAGFGAATYDVKLGQFGASANIANDDFLAAGTVGGIDQSLSIGASDGSQSESALSLLALNAVNKSGGPDGGITQVRLKYSGGSNANDTSDYLGFYPGNATTAAFRPFLRVTYAIPSAVALDVSPGNLNFFEQDINAGAASPQTVTITNLGLLPVTISSASLTGDADFTIADDTGETVLNNGETRNIQIGFDPATVGAKNAQLTIDSNAVGNPTVVVDITGEGTNRENEVAPSELNFGIQILENGPTFAQQVVITNTGTTTLTVSSLLFGGTNPDEFAISNDTGEEFIDAGASRTIDIVFDPDFPEGTKSATLTIETNAFTAPVTVVPLNGSSASAGRRQFGDFDNSGCTDILDFLFLLDNWQLDFNGTPVSIEDFLNLLDNWQLGPTCPPVPTPTP